MGREQYVKRIAIFSPDIAMQEYLGDASLTHFSNDIISSKKKVILQKFENINLSYQMEAEVGRGGEILVILDRVLFPILMGLRNNWARGLIDAFRDNCQFYKIPLIEYDARMFAAKSYLERSLVNHREGVLARLASDNEFKIR